MSQDQCERVAPRLSAPLMSMSVGDTPSDVDQFVVTVRGRFVPESRLLFALTVAAAVASGRDSALIDLDCLDAIDPEDVGLLVRARTHLRLRRQRLVVRSPWTASEVLAACALVDPFASAADVDAGDADSLHPLSV
jgi:hypothetical protein